MIDHVAYTVEDALDPELDSFFLLLGFTPMLIDDEPFEKLIPQRWYTNSGECDVHIVQRENMDWGWQHLCVNSMTEVQFSACLNSEWCVRARPGSPRIWLVGPGGIRVEVRRPDGF